MLRALVLTRYDYACWQVRNAHGRIGNVDVLAAGAARTISVYTQILLVDLDFDVLVNLRINEQRSERRVPARVLIERRDAHQSVHAGFGGEQSICVFTLDFNGHAFDPSFFTGLIVDDFSFEAAPLSPLEIHT